MWSHPPIELVVFAPGLISLARLLYRRIHRWRHGRPPRRWQPDPAPRTAVPALVLMSGLTTRQWDRIADRLVRAPAEAGDATSLQRAAAIQLDAADTMLRRLIEETAGVSSYARARLEVGRAGHSPNILATP